MNDRDSRNQWDTKLRTRGHWMAWTEMGKWPSRRHLGECRFCGGLIECGNGPARQDDLGRQCSATPLCCGAPLAVRGTDMWCGQCRHSFPFPAVPTGGRP